MLRKLGAESVTDRVVVEGTVLTAAGVSAGTDMPLHFAALEAGEQRGAHPAAS